MKRQIIKNNSFVRDIYTENNKNQIQRIKSYKWTRNYIAYSYYVDKKLY